MTTRRFAAVCAAAFLVAQILAIAIHGFILSADYAPFYGNLLRPMPESFEWRMLLLPLSHLSFIIAFVWIVNRVAPERPSMADGLKFGAIAWMIGQAPLWLLWYAEQPWPGALVVKQLLLELASALILGVVVTAMVRRAARRVHAAGAVHA
jgi:hypothetical protein